MSSQSDPNSKLTSVASMVQRDKPRRRGREEHNPGFDPVNEDGRSSRSREDSMQQMFRQFCVSYLQPQNMNGIALNSVNFNLHNQIILVSGTTDHIFCNKNLLTNLELTNIMARSSAEEEYRIMTSTTSELT